MLMVLTQNSRPASGNEIAATKIKFDPKQSMTIWSRAADLLVQPYRIVVMTFSAASVAASCRSSVSGGEL
jgi:hypothetical protein